MSTPVGMESMREGCLEEPQANAAVPSSYSCLLGRRLSCPPSNPHICLHSSLFIFSIRSLQIDKPKHERGNDVGVAEASKLVYECKQGFNLNPIVELSE